MVPSRQRRHLFQCLDTICIFPDLSAMKNKINFQRLVLKNWVLIFLLLLICFFSILEPAFFSIRNVNNILIASTAVLLLAAGETFVIISGGIDLSVGFIMGFSAVSSATVMQFLFAKGAGYPEPVCIIAGCLAGLLLGLIPGLVNGILVARFRVPPFIATLGMYGIANGVAMKICGGFPVSFLPPLTGKIGNGYLAYYSSKSGLSLFQKPVLTDRADILALVRLVPVSVIIVAVLLIIFGLILSKTRLHLIRTYVISSFLASCAGVLLVLRFTMGNHTQFGATYELFAIASVVIGGASLMGGKGTIYGTVVGVLLLGSLEIGFVMIGVEVFYRYIAVGCILIFAVLVDQVFPDLVHNE